MKYPIFKVHIDTEDALRNLREVIESGYIAEGTQVAELAEHMSKYLGHPNITMLNSCTSALTLAMKLAGVGPGDEVITTSMTCLASNTPIHNLGARVVWADINADTGMIDPEEVRQAITFKTKAVVCVNWGGTPAELGPLQHICESHGIKLIQDAAHAFGARYQGKTISQQADFTCFSLQAIKHVTSGDGGILVCRSDEDHERAMKLRWFGIDRNASKDADGNWKGQAWNIDVPEAGYKFHMNNLSAAIGLSQIKHIPRIMFAHNKNANEYLRSFKDHDLNQLVRPLEVPSGGDSAYWVFTVLINDAVDRDKVLEALNKEYEIGAAMVHVPNHPYTCFQESYRELPETDLFASRQISLPCGWWLRSEDIEFIARKVVMCCERFRTA
jgi:dTDP-4-amino-4,6-dideoxygalactose transaminase